MRSALVNVTPDSQGPMRFNPDSELGKQLYPLIDALTALVPTNLGTLETDTHALLERVGFHIVMCSQLANDGMCTPKRIG